MKRGDTFETHIESLAFGGRGVGRAEDGRVAFVDGALPHETVRAAYTKIKKEYVEAALEDVLLPSPERVEPACVHFGTCGGCRLQHLAYPAQARAKESQLGETLAHVGGLTGLAVREVVKARDAWRYRNKMDFTFGTDREGALFLGLHRRGRFDRIVDVEHCWLVDERVSALLARVREWARENSLAPYDPRRATGLLRYLVVRLSRGTGDVLVDLVTTSVEPPESAAFVQTVRSVFAEATVVHTTHRGRATAYVVETQQTLAGTGVIEELIGDVRFGVSAQTFFQTNTVMAERLFEVAAEAAGLKAQDRLLDLYCGTGAIGLTLAGRVASVTGLESNEAAVEDARRNAASNGIDGARFVVAAAEEGLADVMAEQGPFDVVIVDPPRAGLHPKALAALAAQGPDRMAYVSCNPATLARDLAGLAEGGYRSLWVRPVDMFPHTPHIEAVASVVRARS
jgi:23S rRNA (uracil1939-C5)-methyltransferase